MAERLERLSLVPKVPGSKHGSGKGSKKNFFCSPGNGHRLSSELEKVKGGEAEEWRRS